MQIRGSSQQSITVKSSMQNSNKSSNFNSPKSISQNQPSFQGIIRTFLIGFRGFGVFIFGFRGVFRGIKFMSSKRPHANGN